MRLTLIKDHPETEVKVDADREWLRRASAKKWPDSSVLFLEAEALARQMRPSRQEDARGVKCTRIIPWEEP
jgi:hypothetical protein